MADRHSSPGVGPEAVRRYWEQTIPDPKTWESGDPTLTYKPPAAPPAPAGPGRSVELPDGAALTESVIASYTEDGDWPAAARIPSAPCDYVLLECIGEGGMGVVWRARQTSLVREVALKQAKEVAPGTEAERHDDQFVSEALVTGSLDHPNIVPVHALGRDSEGRPFLSMKLVRGISWKDLLHPATAEHRERAAKLDLDGQLGILLSVCNAVAFAHSRNIAHLDLKPANVMVGNFGEVLVMDWGIAVDISEGLPEKERRGEPRRTRHRTSVMRPAGTPAYLAPEMAEGRGPEIGPWTDVYLLGAILHEIITGGPPHRGGSLAAVLWAAMESGPKEYGPEAPAALADICRRAMAKDIRERYQTAAELQAALREFLRHRESMQIAERADAELGKLAAERGRPAGAASRYERYADALSRHRQALELWEGNEVAKAGMRRAALEYSRAALAAGDLGLAEAQLKAFGRDDAEVGALRGRIAVARAEAERKDRTARRMREGLMWSAAVIFAGVAVGFFWIRHERDVARRRETEARAARADSEAARREEARQRTQAEREAEKAKAVGSFLQRMLSSADPERDGRDVKVLELVEKADAEIGTAFARQPEILAVIRHTLGRTFFSLGEFGRAGEHLRAAVTMRKEALGAEHPDTLGSAFELAAVEWRLGRHASAERMHREVLLTRRRVLGAEHRDALRSMSALAIVVAAQGRHAEAEKTLRRALSIQKRVLGPEDRDSIDTVFRIASVVQCQGRQAEAERMLREMLEAEAGAFGAQQPGLLLPRGALRSLLKFQGKFVDADARFREALRRTRDALGVEPPATVDSADDLTDVLRSLGKSGESARLCRDIIAARARTLGAEHPRTIAAMHDLGAALAAGGRHLEAEKTYGAVVKSARRVLGADHPDTLGFERSLAGALSGNGRHAEAEALLRRTLEAQTRVMGPGHPGTLHSTYALAAILYRRAGYAEAERLWREVLRTAGPVSVARHPRIHDTMRWLLLALRRQGKDAEAEEAAQAYAASLGIVTRWRAAGPFELGLGPVGDKARESRASGPPPAWEKELPPEKEYRPDARWTGGAGGETGWRAAEARGDGLVDLDALYGAPDPARGSGPQAPRAFREVAVARAWIHAAKGGPFTFWLGSGDSILVRVAGREVHGRHVVRDAAPDQDSFVAELRRGWNEIVVKVADCARGWGFYFRLEDPEGVLKHHATPPAEEDAPGRGR